MSRNLVTSAGLVVDDADDDNCEVLADETEKSDPKPESEIC